MLKRKFERTRGNRLRVQQFCSTYWDIRDIGSFFCLKKWVMFKGPKNLFELLKSSRNWVFEFSRVNYISYVKQFFLVQMIKYFIWTNKHKTKNLKNGSCYQKVNGSCEAVSSVKYNLILPNFIVFFGGLNGSSAKKKDCKCLC